MTREEAIAEVNKLGLTGQAREQKINELIGKSASNFEGGTAKENKSLKNKLIASPEDMQKMTSNRDDVKGAIRRSQIANPSVGVVDRVTGNVTGLNEDILDPTALKSSDLKADGTVKEKSFTLGNGASGNFVGAETKNSGSSGNSSYASTDKMNDYFAKNDKIASDAEDKFLKAIKDKQNYNWQETKNTMEKYGDTVKNIEDKYIQQLPTFMYQRYKNGEFGDLKDPESKKNAQLRLAHFMINGLGTALSNASNVIKGKELEQSDYEKYQNSNLEQGLANRWMKNNAETEELINLANKEANYEQDARQSVEQLTRNNQMQSRWNAMDQNQKLWSINVAREIGSLVGDMDVSELANFITGSAINGDISKEEVIAVGVASLVSKSPELLEQLPEGGLKSAVKSLLGIGK